MEPYVPWKVRLLRITYDIRHPINAVQRTLMIRFCQRHNCVIVPADEWLHR